jgi:hypothetical protein
VDADAPFHAALATDTRIPLRGQPLQPQGALDGADHRAELDQQAVAGRFDDATAVLRDDRIISCAVLAQCLNRANLVRPHQS